MTRYTTNSGGCFGATSTVVVRVGGVPTVREMKDVVPGDEVEVEGGGFARVTCVVRLAAAPNAGLVSIPGGPTLTSHHPVKVGGVWRAPEGLGPIVGAGGLVYNLVLEHTHSVMVDGYPCVTLGHGMRGPGVEHAFYGTQAVIDALAALPGYASGSVYVHDTVRSAEGHAVGFVSQGAATGMGTGSGTTTTSRGSLQSGRAGRAARVVA